ncbi:hypothetical protein [Roseomonas sp. WA12]
MDPIQEAGTLLARARTGDAIAGLPDTLRPKTMDAAEAIQHATLTALGDRPGGWKVGRLEGQVFTAPIPAAHIVAQPEGKEGVSFRPERFIELELALVFRRGCTAADMASLVLGDLPDLATPATLLEFVRPRFLPDARVTALERIADCMANQGAMLTPTLMPWRLEDLDLMGTAILSQDGEVISRRDGAHVAAPVVPLIDALLDRLRRGNRGIAAGEVFTLGSLSGMPPIPAAGAEYLGEVGQLTPLTCRVAPV